MNNLVAAIEYDGTNFVGWQYQKNGQSIQEKIDLELEEIKHPPHKKEEQLAQTMFL